MSDTLIKKNWGLIITLLIVVVFIFIWKAVPFDELLYLVKDNLRLVVIFYVVFHFIADVFSPIGSSPLFISGSYLMGDWVYVAELISAVLCSVVNFYLARRWGIKFLSIFISKNGIKKIEDLLGIFSKIPLLPLRFFTFSFNDYASYAYGLTNVNFTKYLLMSIFTSVFWLSIWKFFLEDTLFNVGMFFVWFYVVSIPFFLIGWISSRKEIKRKKIFDNGV